MVKTYVINMLSGPGSGKSTLSRELFVHMKKIGYRVEYLQEYAKKLVWQKKYEILNNQHLVSYKYYQSIRAMNECVDFIILDSSLLNGIWYNRHNNDNLSNVEKTEELILKYYGDFVNINFFINRGNIEYENTGRIQSEEESKKIDLDLKYICLTYDISYKDIIVDQEDRIKEIMDYILKNCCD